MSMQEKKLASEKGLNIHQIGGRSLRDQRPPGYFSSLVSKRWDKWRKANKVKGKKKAKK